MVDPTPPSPMDLIRRVLPDVTSPTRELRRVRALGSRTMAVPEPMDVRGKKARYEVEAIWEDSDEFWDGDMGGFDYRNLAGTVDPVTGETIPGIPQAALDSTVDTSPAPMTLMPTSSIFPRRPRTTAAGYDIHRQVLTVLFRDGTYYNYYDVSNTSWWNFKRAHSKGQYIKLYLDAKRRGPAAVDAAMDWEHMEAIYRASRTAQVAARGVQKGQKAGSKRRKAAWDKSSYKGKYRRPY